MLNRVQIKIALVTCLVASALIGIRIGAPHVNEWLRAALLFFGVFNVFVSAAGPERARAIAIGVACAALAWPTVTAVVAVFAWLLWVPWFMVLWAFGQQARTAPSVELEQRREVLAARIGVAAVIGAVAVASVAYRLMVAHRLQQTAALFVGIPALLAIVVVFAVSPRSATGVACKAVTVGLLVSGLFLGEGILCILMSAPLFYAVAIAIGSLIDWGNRRRDTSTLFSLGILLAVVPMSLEGVTDFTTLSRDESVTVSKIVGASSQEVQRALFDIPRFDRVLPLYLRAGFPRAVSTRIEPADGTMHWIITMRGGEMRIDGMEPRIGDLILQLEESRPGLVRWRAVSDSSHMTHFLNWQEVVVEWKPVGAAQTKVTWTLRYRRGLDPAWYFGPWERYAVGLAAGYLIDSVATP